MLKNSFNNKIAIKLAIVKLFYLTNSFNSSNNRLLRSALTLGEVFRMLIESLVLVFRQ